LQAELALRPRMQIPRGGGGVIAPHPPYLFRDQQLSIL